MATATQLSGENSIQGTALSRFVRVSPQKARLVIDLIRGHRAEDALETLRFTKKRIAKDIEKILRSAIANAERKADDAGTSLDVDQLYVSTCFVNEGPRWKRMRPAPQGRGFRYQKRTAHITVQVAEHVRAAENRAAEAAAEAAASKGVKGAIRKARKTIEKRAKEAQKVRNKKK
jgi:large subunit ribosomal protein L22